MRPNILNTAPKLQSAHILPKCTHNILQHRPLLAHKTSCYGLNCVPPKFLCSSSNHSCTTHNVTVEIGTLRANNKVKVSHVVGPKSNMIGVALWDRQPGGMHVHRESVRWTQWKGDHQQAKERGLRRNLTYWHFDLGLKASRTMKK